MTYRRETWSIQKLLAEVEPGDHDWSWRSQFNWLLKNHIEELELLAFNIGIAGRIEEPLLIGNDGRLWDGHHRLYLGYIIGITEFEVDIAP